MAPRASLRHQRGRTSDSQGPFHCLPSSPHGESFQNKKTYTLGGRVCEESLIGQWMHRWTLVCVCLAPGEGRGGDSSSALRFPRSPGQLSTHAPAPPLAITVLAAPVPPLRLLPRCPCGCEGECVCGCACAFWWGRLLGNSWGACIRLVDKRELRPPPRVRCSTCEESSFFLFCASPSLPVDGLLSSILREDKALTPLRFESIKKPRRNPSFHVYKQVNDHVLSSPPASAPLFLEKCERLHCTYQPLPSPS